MKLIIDIPEEDYIRLRDEGMFGNVTTFKRAVREGTPLPKGHGRLIDESKITKCEQVGLIIKDGSITRCLKTDAPTIIEADKVGK